VPVPYPDQNGENNSHPFASSPLPKPQGWSRRARTLTAIAVIAVLVASLVGASWLIFGGFAADSFAGPIWTVKREKLVLTIVERGALESVENSDIYCKVKAGSKSSMAASTIKWVIEDGTQVRRGQKLLELDASAFEENLREQNIKVDKAKADWIKKDEDLQIVKNQNHSDIQKAIVDIELARLELEKYTGLPTPKYEEGKFQQTVQTILKNMEESSDVASHSRMDGEYHQLLQDILGKREIAKSELEMWRDRAAWSKRMNLRGFYSDAQARADQARLESSEHGVKNIENQKILLERFTKVKNVTDLVSKWVEANRALGRVEFQAKSKETTAEAERHSTKSIYLQGEEQRDEIMAEIKKCTVYSPQDGLVVYNVTDQSWRSSSSQQVVAQGEAVKEGQKLMRIPDLSRMQVEAKVHEAMVSRLRGELLRPTGFTDALRAANLVGLDPTVWLTAQAAISELKDNFRDKDYEQVYPGQRATIRVDAYPNKILKGHVRSVATVKSGGDFMSSDVTVYKTIVVIDDPVENLKPGMNAEVNIFADETTEPVLTVPIQSVLGNITMGAKRKVYVLSDGQPQERDIIVGMSNATHVEVRDGLTEGEKVVINPGPLVRDKTGMKPGVPSARRGQEDGDGGGGGGKKAGKGKGGKGGGFAPKGFGPKDGFPGGPGDFKDGRPGFDGPPPGRGAVERPNFQSAGKGSRPPFAAKNGDGGDGRAD
jgi:HlyD family secretion protein